MFGRVGSVRSGLLLLSLVAVAPLAATRDAAKPEAVVLRECLLLPPVGQYGRTPLHTDALEAQIVTGAWKAPRAGDAVALPDGGAKRWEAVVAKDGGLEQATHRGGYVYWPVQAEAARVALLDASGYTVVYVNGEPRVGDPYGNGIVRVPIQLRQGTNDLLFQGGRGRLQAKLTVPEGPALLDTRDATLPDILGGDTVPAWAAVVAVNASAKPLDGIALRARVAGTEPLTTPVGSLPPLSMRKVGFRVPVGTKSGNNVAVDLELLAEGGNRPLATAKLALRMRQPGQSYKRTFISGIDGSVQYFAVQPAHPPAKDGAKPALVLTLHGASVEALGQADAYGGKPWCHIVAPTNRRPFGFDWEEWGRQDALEVLDLAREQLGTDPVRTYLTGHSMGGHGAWQVGVTFPDRFAAIAPSAGWISFATYGGAKRPDKPTPMQAMLLRAASPGETLTLVRNCARQGVYVLHGDADDNVPVTEARAMRQQLGTFHSNFVYYERPGAGHWWGSACVDWPPLFDFLARHTLPLPAEVRQVDFTTASPGVSARCEWAEISTQVQALRPSNVQLHLDPEKRQFSGATDNVARLSLDVSTLPPDKPISVELDGQKLAAVPWPASNARLWFAREGTNWATTTAPAPSLKQPRRYGPFKEAFRNRMLFVYGTKGTPAENAWAYAKARYDAETFWYRGNGAVPLCADVDFDADQDGDRNVIVYGHSESNAAWNALLAGSPVEVRRGAVRLGERELKGDDLACLFVRPRPKSERALVGVVSGSGLPGLRLTERMPYFLSGVGYPDCIVLGADALAKGAEGVRVAGFFGNDWSVPSGEWVWHDAK